jgi:uncharacterized integral membrane protein
MIAMLLKLISLLSIVLLLVLSASNVWQTVDVLLFTTMVKQWPLGIMLLGAAVIGFVAAWFWVMPSVLQHRSDHKKTKRILEKSQLLSETHGSQVKALEAKVATLEVALQKALQTSTTGEAG